jgi:DNA-directed RNA polymerase specialized sigma24 family protein
MRLSFQRKKRNAGSFSPEDDICGEGAEQLYAHYRSPFIGYIRKRYELEEEMALDIYHDSFLLMMDNIRTGKYQKQDASLFTYLMGIGRHLVLKRLQKEDKLPLVAEWVSGLCPDVDWRQAQEEAYRLMNESDSPCNRILRFFYWDRLSMAEIAERLGYQSADVAKSRKNACLRRFSIELKRRLEYMGIFYKLKK